jgi:hypothetical protein
MPSAPFFHFFVTPALATQGTVYLLQVIKRQYPSMWGRGEGMVNREIERKREGDWSEAYEFKKQYLFRN